MATQDRKNSQTVTGDDMNSSLEDLIGYNLKRAYVVAQEDFRAALGQDDFSSRVFSALALTVENPNVTQSALARHLGIERSGLVAIVDGLEARGLIKRTAVPGDRRVQALVPTEAGQATYAAALDSVQRHEKALFSKLTDTEQQTLLTLLKKIRSIENDK